MRKSAIIFGLLCQLFCFAYSQELNNASRFRFAGDVSKIIGSKYADKNFAVSPVSIQTVLVLAYLGANGETAEDLIKALHLESYASKDVLAKEYGYFQQLINKDDGKVKMANRIYLDSKFDIAPLFNEYARDYFQSGVEKVNFISNIEAASTINNWVEHQTNNKIKNLVSPDTFNEDTAAVLVNALYFKANWLKKFKKFLTEDREFHLNENEQISVSTMMSSPMNINYCESTELDVKAVELPYEGTDLKMVIWLPNKKTGVSQLQTSITRENIKNLAQSCRKENVIVLLPKFKVETELDLKQHLKDLGLEIIFSNKADFSGWFASSTPVSITEAKQKVFISVDENGSEAAAATYAVGSTRMGHVYRHEPIQFKVDRPFAFAIKDDHGIYFMGHVVKPEFN